MTGACAADGPDDDCGFHSMLSASSGVRISSKSEKSEIDKSSIVVFKPRGIVDELSVEVAAVTDVFSTR